MRRRYAWLLVILLAAALLRLARLDQVPPGLTHDEADHGLDAWGVVNGVRPIYFTVGYGREPLFDYTTAGLMAFLGPTYLAGRLAAVYFSLVLLAGTYAWTRLTFGHQVALFSAAGLATSFWGVMTGRQALRSVTLPALFVLAVYFFWRGLRKLEKPRRLGHEVCPQKPAGFAWSPLLSFLAAGVLLGATFYTYFPARLLWLIFPAQLFYLALRDRRLLARAWPGVVLMLLVAAGVAWPLFGYLAAHPEAEARLDQLSQPLEAAGQGDFRPLWTNVLAGLQLLTFEGDHQWRYNIAGRPVLPLALGLLFYAGLVLALWQMAPGWRSRPANLRPGTPAATFFALVWLAAGWLPSLVTGPELSTTRLIGLQPVLYLFPALALALLLENPFLAGIEDGQGPSLGLEDKNRKYPLIPRVRWLVLLALFIALFVQTAWDYFVTWANEPEVRVQYETALVTALRYLNDNGPGAAAISTTTPGRFHSPAVAQLALDNPAVSLRWFNGQGSLLLPMGSAQSTLVFTGFAALDPALAGYFTGRLVDTLPMQPTDLDRPLLVYQANGPALLAQWREQFAGQPASPAGAAAPIPLGQAVEWLGYDLQTPAISPGGEVRLATLWRVQQPLDEAVIFTHLLGPAGLVAQEDRLDAPSYFWVPGDVFIQLHRLFLPAGLPPGDYALSVGVYTRPDERRLPVLVNGAAVGDALQLPPVQVVP